MDIDLDFSDREQVLKLIKHVPAAIEKDGKMVKHNTGVYVSKVPMDCLNGICGIDHKEAEKLGFVKLDFLNMSVYDQIQTEEELDVLMNTEPNWDRLLDKEFCEKVVHLGNHYELVAKMKPTNIHELAMLLAVIRPSKRPLANKSWNEIRKTVWDEPEDGSYYFKKAHGYAYAHLLVVHMNLLNLFN